MGHGGDNRSVTHEVFNQPPPLVGYDVAEDAALLEGAGPRGRRLGGATTCTGSASWPAPREAQRWAERGQPVRAAAASPTTGTATASTRSSSTRPGTALMDGRRRRGAGRRAVGRRPARRARGPRRRPVHLESGRGRPLLPDLDDVRRRPRAAHRPGAGRRVRAAADQPRLRPGPAHAADQARAARRHGDDREAGRLGRARQHHHRRPPAGDGTYRLRGHKWFTSAPMCDLFLVLAQAPAGLSCFLVPRVLPDGTPQRLPHPAPQGQAGQPQQRQQRAGVRRHGRAGWSASEGQGVRTIIEMVAMTRLDCVDRVRGRHARRAQPGDPPRPAPARRSAARWSTSR